MFPESKANAPFFASRKERLIDRAHMLMRARHFFLEKRILEVDCPILSSSASVDAHIDLISACYDQRMKYFLHSSPEYGMKRLLSEGMGDIYQLSHVFRDGELGDRHNPEFMMAEWYRMSFSLEAMIVETLQFLSLFLSDTPSKVISYRELFKSATGIDYLKATTEELYSYLLKEGISVYPAIHQEGKDGLLNLILTHKIEPLLGQDTFLVLTHYPATQAALAKKKYLGEEEVAERFEIYYQGIELANGYHELIDVEEQRKRLLEANKLRLVLGKEELPIDYHFLHALEQGIPECSGVAVGFDRVLMLRQRQARLADVLPFAWERV